MATLTEGQTPGDFLMFEESAHYSRQEITVAAGADLEPGTVLGKVTASGAFVACDPAASDGAETAAGVLLTPAAAKGADVPKMVMLARHSQVRRGGLTFGSGITTSGQRDTACDQLNAVGIQTL